MAQKSCHAGMLHNRTEKLPGNPLVTVVYCSFVPFRLIVVGKLWLPFPTACEDVATCQISILM